MALTRRWLALIRDAGSPLRGHLSRTETRHSALWAHSVSAGPPSSLLPAPCPCFLGIKEQAVCQQLAFRWQPSPAHTGQPATCSRWHWEPWAAFWRGRGPLGNPVLPLCAPCLRPSGVLLPGAVVGAVVGRARVAGTNPQACPHLARLFIAHKGPFFSDGAGLRQGRHARGEASELSLSFCDSLGCLTRSPARALAWGSHLRCCWRASPCTGCGVGMAWLAQGVKPQPPHHPQGRTGPCRPHLCAELPCWAPGSPRGGGAPMLGRTERTRGQ